MLLAKVLNELFYIAIINELLNNKMYYYFVWAVDNGIIENNPLLHHLF